MLQARGELSESKVNGSEDVIVSGIKTANGENLHCSEVFLRPDWSPEFVENGETCSSKEDECGPDKWTQKTHE